MVQSLILLCKCLTPWVVALVLGFSEPFTGWALLAIGVGSTVWAAVLEPSELEAWARQMRFGLGPDKDKFKNVDALFGGLQRALGQANESMKPATNEAPPQPTPAENMPYSDPMTGLMVAP